MDVPSLLPGQTAVWGLRQVLTRGPGAALHRVPSGLGQGLNNIQARRATQEAGDMAGACEPSLWGHRGEV